MNQLDNYLFDLQAPFTGHAIPEYTTVTLKAIFGIRHCGIQQLVPDRQYGRAQCQECGKVLEAPEAEDSPLFDQTQETTAVAEP